MQAWFPLSALSKRFERCKEKIRQDQSGHMLSSESYKNVMFDFILKQASVFLCVRPFVKGQQGHKREKVSQTYLPDWEHNLTVNANISLIFAQFSSQMGQTVITVNTWAASRLYISTPGALHLGQEALCSFLSCSRQIITRHPGGTWALEFCQAVLN